MLSRQRTSRPLLEMFMLPTRLIINRSFSLQRALLADAALIIALLLCCTLLQINFLFFLADRKNRFKRGYPPW